ncbi:hypothetical protein [Chitinophaga arvensicola]|uniref:WD40-like Beta Propeller Repeat n=1 Tax=Chitinophaga arvensicola TaxID=29529 RepID=A0A1I0NUJ3_9BACT|nr:hypothetical protein [Chitinophaga arvensicola]SEW05307.1 hypothetical protein SAMN04488122_0380 [Chitinophaga arvensicola]
MKKLLLGTIALLAFNAAVIITQMSCKKEAQAETPVVRPSLVLYINSIESADRSVVSELWIAKLDGTNKTKLNITLPANTVIAGHASLSPDGQTVVFSANEIVSTSPYVIKDGGIYSAPLNGTTARTPKRIIEPSTTGHFSDLQGVY